MGMPKLLESLSVDDLPNEGLQYIANACGIEIAKALIMHCAGMSFQIPVRPSRDSAKRYIEIHYDGANVRALAKETGMSCRFVYKVLREKSSLRVRPS